MAKTRIFGVILLTATLLLAGCTEAEDDEVDPEDTSTLQLYSFEGSDSSTSVSSNSGEDLADVMMEVGAEILWDEVVVTIMVDESAPYVCSTDSNDESACHYETNQQAYWSVGDSITIKEGNDDLCSSVCMIDITISKQSDGSEHVIGNVDVTAE
jgi:ABC-type oligopeptide transport system substrate-binding subunit